MNNENSKSEFQANHISLQERIRNIFISAFLIFYGAISVANNEFYFPLKRSITEGERSLIIYGEIPCWIMFASFLFAAINLLTVVVDHYDKRNNEINYKQFSRITFYTAITLFFIAGIYFAFSQKI